jgi:hypothetical protein
MPDVPRRSIGLVGLAGGGRVEDVGVPRSDVLPGEASPARGPPVSAS